MASPAPTTFVQTDTATFRDLVQKLTGLTPTNSNPPSPKPYAPRRPPFKLNERRRRAMTMKKLDIIKLAGLITSHSLPVTTFFFSGGDDSSSPADTPPNYRSSAAVAENLGFYLQPSSPVTTPRGTEPPELLPLFPLTSPKDAR